MEPVKRIEIITNSLEIPLVLEILDKIGSGYTIIKEVTGKGDRGRVIDDLETQAFTNGYVLSICTLEQHYDLVAKIKPVLKKYGGVCIVSDAEWIAH
ncbi:P-II family nitrogen regulator [Rivularia sp. UHCC 0363]|uniref:P-II family nitrogen regulator n=1 Tax=Rivularia sp. UHCC 0363 TaxID=3110244 RepID=UPI002B20FAFB|nr:transcriptional regulator [Rivularia sp. UHCC 0363]MEA5593307.1 transcriptional regulator [Rivularia sp. UHCC 0363]